MRSYRNIAVRSALVILCLGWLWSCSDDSPASVKTPRNLVKGVADGIDFEVTSLGAAKDSNDVFLMIGNLGRSGSFIAAFSGTEEKEYPVAEEGPVVALTNYLNDLIAADSFFIDTAALEMIFSDSAQLLPTGTSFMFFTPQNTPFFSRRGNITLSVFDGSINRIYGTFEGEFINAGSGPTYINAIFEDVFYIDCPLVDDCGL